MKKFLRDNGLGLAFGVLFLGSLVGQAFSGNADVNARRLADGGDPIGLWQYVLSSDFAVDVAENWQSEYLQFFLFIFATVWLMQRGSNESKLADRLGPESDEQQYLGRHARSESPPWARAGGWRTRLYSNSLGLVMLGLFLGSWLTQSIAGRSAYNNEQLVDFQDPASWWDYVLSADFWNRSLQNWQSEFLAIGSMAIFSVYLRQRGSSESKPVGAPHDRTDVSG
ncbi:hypothetical protein FHS29_006869 [Saccharothrix tamanrassetensis]|uniref:Uncharacterized protein n=1 Tax=Saccharothrix tamanrassetensis TaxID=1051531 RepID=A0A841CY27_9PSEU|nr:DUF6766 family protein [Saccharothrix tamanrassetensis]MBB5960246.1 hypothetical protein [Saccharothrix tamanrassetensis]